jgi:geranylgeranyl pyrophosphate synthase
VPQRLAEFLPPETDAAGLTGYVGRPTWVFEPRVYRAAIAGPAWDLIRRRGKSWRPFFALLMLSAFGGDAAAFEGLFCVLLELGHTGSLIVDDIEDGAVVRRGAPSIHRRYGVDIALNAGNALYFLPLLAIDRHPRLTARQKLRLHGIMLRHYIRAHFGQGLDIYWSRALRRAPFEAHLNEAPGPKILQMYAHKTASAVVAATEIAAVIAPPADVVRRRAVAFANALGVAYQIVDDVLDFDGRGCRRPGGQDLTGGKFTYVLVRALEALPPAPRRRLWAIVRSAARRGGPAARAEGIALVRRSGALEGARRDAETLCARAWSRLDAVLPDSPHKQRLRGLWAYLLGERRSA